MSNAAARLIIAWTLGNVGFRIAMVALPLLAVAQTGSAWTVGLVTGAAGVPVITAPWWSRPAQARLGSVGALAWLMCAEGAVSLCVPLAARLDLLGPVVMIGIGLCTGVLNAVSGPLDASLLATLGDAREVGSSHEGSGRGAARMLSAQDGSIKAATTMAPLASLVLIQAVGLTATVAADGLLTLVGAACLVGLRVDPVHLDPGSRPQSVRHLLHGQPTIVIGFVVRAAGCGAWFAFTLCLALVGEQRGIGVQLATVGLSSYAAGAVAGSLLGVYAAGTSRPALLNSASWLLAGAGWVVIGLHPTLLLTGVTAAAMGLVVPAGNAATTALVTRAYAGAARRSMLTAQATVVTGSTTLGVLVGGPLIALVGAAPAIVAAGGCVTTIACVGLFGALRERRSPRRSAPLPAQCASRRERLGTGTATPSKG